MPPLLPHRPEEPVAATGSTVLTAAELLRRAAVVAAALPPASPGSRVVFAFDSDRAAMVAAMFGAWAAGHAVSLPADARRESVAPLLARADAAVLVHDTGVGRGIDVPKLLAQAALEVSPIVASLPAQEIVLHGVWPAIEGPAETTALSAEALVERLTSLADHFSLSAGSTVGSTLSPTCVPGVMLSVLAPLHVSGRFWAFAGSDPGSDSEEIAAQACATGVSLLVSAPAHLRRLAALPQHALGMVDRLATAVGSVDARTSAALQSRHGLAVEELFARPESEAARSVRWALLGADGVEDAVAVAAPEACKEKVFAVAVAPELSVLYLMEQIDESLRPSVSLRLARALERDPNGGFAAPRVHQLFGFGADGRPLARTLVWEDVSHDGAEHVYRTTVPENFFYFEGHFPPYPVLAGAVQVHEMVLPCLRRAHPEVVALTKLSGLKFLARICPGDAVELRLTVDAERGVVDFAILRDGTKCSAGRLAFSPVAGEGSG